MITIIHGEDILAEQKYKIDLISKNIGKEILELNNPTETEVLQATESKSLFNDEKIIILNQINKIEKVAEKIKDSNAIIYIFVEKKLSPKQLSYFSKSQVILFKAKALIFDFLDSLRPKNQKQMLTLFKNLTINEEAELIFYMLVRQIRNLILVKDGTWTSEISPWQKSKLEGQARYFPIDKLLELYKNLEKIDYENKSGLLALDLSKSLELFLLKI